MREEDKSYASVVLDHGREERNRFREVIFCERKRPEHLLEIVARLLEKGENVFGTRCDAQTAARLREEFPRLHYDAVSRTLECVQKPPEPLSARLGLLAAGTADVPVAEEAWRTARFYGAEAARFYDVGVAGLHRLLSRLDALRECDVLIVVAGMEGALPSVVGGLVRVPVIACPTSVGYGSHFSGLASLLAMLNSCSEGISVVNIDNGFGAACAALRILRRNKKND